MKVCFLHVRQQPAHALKMIASVKEAMPWVEIVHLADNDEPALTASVQRLPWDGTKVEEYRLRHLAALPGGEWLSLDTDVLVQHDLAKVFAFPFDVALTQRDSPVWDTNGNDVTQAMPFNAGVMWWRSPQFWADCHAWITQQSDAIQKWYGSQLVLPIIAERYRTLKLHCDNFNYSPDVENEDVSARFAVHYKGWRKAWMLSRSLQGCSEKLDA